MSSAWRRGWNLEDRVRKDLTRHGYVDVLRSPLSRGPWDIRGKRAGVTLYVQCKSNGYCDPAGWNALWQYAGKRGAVAVIVGEDPRRAPRLPHAHWSEDDAGTATLAGVRPGHGHAACRHAVEALAMLTSGLERRLERLEQQDRDRAMPRAKRFRPPSLREFVESLQIEDKVTGTLIPFRLWPAQVKALRVMASSDRLFGLKARQLGMTWLDLAYWLWHTQYAGNRLILVARQSLDEAIPTPSTACASCTPHCRPRCAPRRSCATMCSPSPSPTIRASRH